MNLTRRKLTSLLAAGIASTWSAGMAWAQTYPQKSVKLVVGSPPGGPSDFLARMLADAIGPGMGQNFIVENKPGNTELNYGKDLIGTNEANKTIVGVDFDGKYITTEGEFGLRKPMPIIEPINVCELDAGIPKYQVPKFQTIPERSMPKTKLTLSPVLSKTKSFSGSKLTIPIATLYPQKLLKNKPMKFQSPDQTIA